MNINCPICHQKVEKYYEAGVRNWYYCDNQCIRFSSPKNKKEIVEYSIIVVIDDQCYTFLSSKLDINNHAKKLSGLQIYQPLEMGSSGVIWKTIVSLDEYFPHEEVFQDPIKIVKRFLNLKIFS